VLNDPPVVETLVHFPSGYSIGIAAFLSAGFNEAFAIKALGALATMAGWLGWGRLAERYLADGVQAHPWLRPLGMGMAVLTPLLFTLPWAGTDIFLWAIVPWVVLFLMAGDRRPVGWSDSCAGVLVSLAVLMRYASVFIVVFAAALIVLQAWNRPVTLLRRLAALGAGAAPLFLLQMWINSTAADAVPGGVSLELTAAEPLNRLLLALSLLPTAHQMWGFWIPGKLSTILLDVMAPWRWPLVLAVLVYVSLAILFWRHSIRDVRAAAIGVFFPLTAILIAAMMFGHYTYVGDPRYYAPVAPLAVLVAWWVATSKDRGSATFRLPARAYAAAYVLMISCYAFLLLTPTTLGASQRQKVLGEPLLHWPSFADGYSFVASRQLVERMLRETPGALLLSSRQMVFLSDPRFDRTKLYPLLCASTPKRIRGPADVIVVTFDRGNPTDLWYYSGNGVTGSVGAVDCLENLPDLTIVQRFPDEGMKVLRARVPAGTEYISQP
jgi:hypothetical protein